LFSPGSAKGASCPFADVRHPWRTPDGLFPTKTTVLGAAKREKPRPSALFPLRGSISLVSQEILMRMPCPYGF